MSAAGRLRSIAGGAYLALPDGLRDLAPSLQGFGREDVPAPLVVPGPGRRVLIAAQNTAGQGALWSRALDARQGWSSRSLAVPPFHGGFSFAADVTVPPAVFARSRRWGRAQFDAIAGGGADAVLIESLRPVFGRRFSADAAREAGALTDAGVVAGVVWHGSDIRSPARHALAERWSPFVDSADPFTARLQEQVDRTAEAADRLGLTEFVSTPDLLRDRPRAVWLPVVVDVSRWAPSAWQAGPRLRVLHAPSSGRLKGTELVEAVLRRLDAEGVIALTLPEAVPHERMAALVGETDVVIDQFAVGSYGVAACEAMAAGRLVVGHVADDVRDAATAAAGESLPIVEATPDTLDAVLRSIAADPTAFRPHAEAGPDFVARLHDGRAAAEALSRALSQVIPGHRDGAVGESTRPEPIGPE